MKIRASIFFIALAFSLISAETGKIFQTSQGLVRIAVIPPAHSADSTLVPDSSGAASASAAYADSSGDLTALFPGAADPGALLEIYFLEKSTGAELRFPVKGSQMGEALRQYPPATRGDDAYMVALVRNLASSLSVQMKTTGVGDTK